MSSAVQIICEVLRTLANGRFNVSFMELILQTNVCKIVYDGFGTKTITKQTFPSFLLEVGGPR